MCGDQEVEGEEICDHEEGSEVCLDDCSRIKDGWSCEDESTHSDQCWTSAEDSE